MRLAQGFTLVEIRIVVAIIALPVVIAVPSFMRASDAPVERFIAINQRIDDGNLSSGGFRETAALRYSETLE